MSPDQSSSMTSHPIDAVITWVDGDDPQHIAKRGAAQRDSKNRNIITTIPSGRSAIRFKNNGEIGYCLLALRKFAPWLRTIYIVTDGQAPSFLTADIMRQMSIKIVDHKEIFSGYEWALPTFNSRTIETMIHRIAGLSEHFLYLNDDFILLRDTEVTDFFVDDRVVIRGERTPLGASGHVQLLKSSILNRVFEKLLKRNRPMHILPQMKAARMAGLADYFIKDIHTPFAVRRSTISNYFDENPQKLIDNIQYKFRNMLQFNTMPLANHLELAGNHCTFASTDDCLTLSFTTSIQEDVEASLNAVSQGNVRFFCVQSLERASDSRRDKVVAELTRLVGDPVKCFV